MDVAVLLIGWGWSYPQIRAAWTEIEQLGYDIVYIGDDLFPHPDVDDEVYEPWTLIPAIAATTERIKVGSLVSPAGRRNPGLFAKMTTESDLIAGPGRLIVGRGLGNSPEQQETLNQPYPGPAERTEMLKDELEIAKSMWTERRTTYEGKYWQVRDAINSPKPASSPHPEVLLAFRSAKFLPRLAAEYATRVNLLHADDQAIQNLMATLAGHCQDFGRSIDEIVAGRPASIIFTDHEVPTEEIDRVIEERARTIAIDPEYLKMEHGKGLLSYVGPVDACAASLRARTTDLGVREIVVCIDTIGRNSYERTMEGLRLFAAEVIPALKRG